MDKTPQEMVHEINELLGNVPSHYAYEFDIRDLTEGELSQINRIAHNIAIRKQYRKDHGVPPDGPIPQDTLLDFRLLLP